MFKKIIELLKRKYSEVFFIGSDDKLPPPLSEIEEREYVIIKNWNIGEEKWLVYETKKKKV